MQQYKGSLALTVGLAALLAVLGLGPAAHAQSRTIRQISSGKYHTCALPSDGSVQCWGSNAHGQALPQAGPFTQISAGEFQTCGLRSGGSADCWGALKYESTFSPVQSNSGPFTQIAAGADFACGVKTDGNGYFCWGLKYGGGGFQSLTTGPYTQISAFGDHDCALVPSSNSTLLGPFPGMDCTGTDGDALIGDYDGGFVQVTTGATHACAITEPGLAACYGNNAYGQSSPPPDTFLQLSAGNLFTCGLRTDHTVTCWGYNYYGQVSNAPSGTGTFKGVAAGYGHACAWNDYNVVCWGRNDYGQATPTLCLGSSCGANSPRFAFQGFYPPLQSGQTDPPTLNKVEAGSAVPLKFSLGGYKGMNVIAGGAPSSRPLDCEQFDPWGDWVPAQSAGHHGLVYDLQSGSYVYVWKTDPDWAGSCRVLSLKLTDGTEHLVPFQFQ